MRTWVALGAISFVLVVTYYQGAHSVQQKWDKENARVANALVVQALAIRDKEQSLQAAMDEVQRNASQQVEQLRADAAGADSAADRLRERISALLDASQTTGACTSRPAAENPGNLLAVLLDKSVTRNRELAAFADSALNAAKACAAAYEKARG